MWSFQIVENTSKWPDIIKNDGFQFFSLLLVVVCCPFISPFICFNYCVLTIIFISFHFTWFLLFRMNVCVCITLYTHLLRWYITPSTYIYICARDYNARIHSSFYDYLACNCAVAFCHFCCFYCFHYEYGCFVLFLCMPAVEFQFSQKTTVYALVEISSIYFHDWVMFLCVLVF